jgi:glycosyltransferase involved in cell wall biosynthesis
VRILFVAMADSIHTARWIGQLKKQNWDLHLFPCEDGTIHPSLTGVTVHTLLRESKHKVDPELRQTGLRWPFRRGRTRITELIRSRFLTRAAMLARLVERWRPDVVHTLEMQRSGYLTLEARGQSELLRTRPWIYSCWGNDIYHFGRQREHEPLIRRVLQSCDFFIEDCQRDSALAREYGFRGVDLGCVPVCGGFDVHSMQQFRSGQASIRKVIAVKGYQSEMWGGRAVVALQGLKRCADVLKEYEIVVYSAHGNPQVSSAVQELAGAGLRVSVLPQSSHDEMVKLMGRARIALALSTTDGTPNAMLEAMIMGAFPIQSDTVSTGEWIVDGRNGFLVPPEDADVTATAIRKAVGDNGLVDRAADVNDELTRAKVDVSIIKPRVIQMYEQVASSKGGIEHSHGGVCAF